MKYEADINNAGPHHSGSHGELSADQRAANHQVLKMLSSKRAQVFEGFFFVYVWHLVPTEISGTTGISTHACEVRDERGLK